MWSGGSILEAKPQNKLNLNYENFKNQDDGRTGK